MSQSNALAVLTPRSAKGQFTRTPEQIEKDHEAALLRSRSKTFKEIGDHFGVRPQSAYEMVQRAIDDIPREGTSDLIAMELVKLDAVERKYLEIAGSAHPYVSQSGRIVTLEDKDGTEIVITDDGPIMAALAGLLKVADRRAKLLGLNAPTRTELTSTVSISIEDRSEQAKASVLSLLERLKDENEENVS